MKDNKPKYLPVKVFKDHIISQEQFEKSYSKKKRIQYFSFFIFFIIKIQIYSTIKLKLIV